MFILNSLHCRVSLANNTRSLKTPPWPLDKEEVWLKLESWKKFRGGVIKCDVTDRLEGIYFTLAKEILVQLMCCMHGEITVLCHNELWDCFQVSTQK